MSEHKTKLTESTRSRYGRIAPIYDFMETIPELRYRSWRQRFWTEIEGRLPPEPRILEVGVGTGKNMPFWPEDARITAVDLTPGMLQRAETRSQDLGLNPQLEIGDAQSLDFPSNSFDAAAATFVFCSVPDPIQGMNELARVVKPDGYVFLMEHLRATNKIAGWWMDLFNPIVVRLMGPNINRDTVGNLVQSDLALENVENIGAWGIYKNIRART